MAPSTVGRITGATDASNTARDFPRPIDPRTLLYVARAEDWSGPWLWALDVRAQGHATREPRARAIHVGRGEPRRPAHRRHGRQSQRQPVARAAARWARRGSRRGAVSGADRTALAPRFGGTSLFYLSARGTGDGLWRVQDGKAFEVWRGADGALSEPPAVSPDGSRVAVVLRREGKRHLSIMSADGTGSRTLAPSIDIKGARQGTLTGRPTARGS